MKPTRLLAAALAFTLGLALAPAVQATTTTKYTTNGYDAASTDADITKSCKDVYINSQSDTLYGTCNAADADGNVTASDDDIDLETYMYCGPKAQGSDQYILTYGKAPPSPSFRPRQWRVDTDSMGAHYQVHAKCTGRDGVAQAESWLRLSDSTKGFKNDSGDFETRMSGY